MNLKGIIYCAPPKITARVIAAILALLLALAAFKISDSLIKADTENEDQDAVESEELNGGKETESPKRDVFNAEGAISVGAVVNGSSAFLCNLTDSAVIAEKNCYEKVSARDATVFMVALTVSKAINEGRVNLTDEAVCPASAAKFPNYKLSEEVLPIGKRMKIGDILKCMLYQSGSSYAYTLAVHISGSEEAFVSEMNAYCANLKLSETSFVSCTGDEAVSGTISAYDLAAILKAALSEPLIRGIICSDDMITVGYGQSGSVNLVVKNDFFESYCTESQAKNDGIIGGKVGAFGYNRWSAILFSRDGKDYLSLVLDSNDAFADGLMLYTAYVLSVSGG